MASEYQTRYAKGTLSQFFFDPCGSEQLAGRRLTFPDNWADYQRLFVYGATCNNSVREDPAVLALLTPSGCEGNRVLLWEGGRLYPWVSAQPASNLHATAQGLYLLALLLTPDH
jgi:hypothetical protein